MSVGSSLREVRERAGLSREQLAARTRIPESVIEDLEGDNFESSLGVAYVRGHIRTIARTCGEAAEPILERLDSQTIPLNKSIRTLLNEMNVTPEAKPKREISWRSLAGVAVGLMFVALVGAGIFAVTNTNRDSRIVSSNPTQETGAVAKKVDGVEVTLRGINGLSWVAVSDSTGTTQYSGRIRQGEERTFTDDQLIYLVIGNAGAIQLIVNGEDLGVSGEVGEVLRLEFGPQALSSQG